MKSDHKSTSCHFVTGELKLNGGLILFYKIHCMGIDLDPYSDLIIFVFVLFLSILFLIRIVSLQISIFLHFV
jgi:hypothetical protein